MRISSFLLFIAAMVNVFLLKAEGIKDSLNYSQLTITTAFPRIDPMMTRLDSLTTFAFSKKNEYFGNAATVTTPYNPNYSDEQIKKKLAQIPALFPMSFNNDVKTYINYFTQVKRGYTSRMLGLGDVYFPMFEEYIDKMKLPTELKYLPIIESAFNPVAQSRVGATGMWQIMYKTGRMLGLDMNSYIDERMDPRLSTEAGLAYLQQLYGIYGDWQLALAAYNAGPGNVNKAIANAGGVKNFWAIKPFLPMETQNYVPSFIGVVYAMTYHDDYKIAATKPIFNPTFIDTVMIQDRVSLAHISSMIGIPKEEISFLNPSLKLGIIPSSELGFALRLPIGYLARFESKRAEIINDPTMIMDQPLASSGLTEDIWVTVPKILTHVVKKGETLASIARKYAVDLTDIKKWNKLKTTSLKSGQKLTIKSETTKKVTTPVASSTGTINTNGTYSPPKSSVAVVTPPTPIAKTTIETWENVTSTKYHYVKSGETLSGIADKYNVSLSQIKTWNKLSSTKILKGQKLAIKTTERKKVIKTVDVPAASTPVAKYNADDNMTLTPEESKHMPSNGIKYALHTVQKGETLSTITGLYAGSSEDGIKQLNNLASSELKVGATIKIPLQ